MTQFWKRMACLLLSGILLLGSVPIPTLAAEEVLEEAIEEGAGQEVCQDLDAAAEIGLMTAGLFEDEEEPQEPVYYPVYVNGVQITSDNQWDVLGDGSVSYDGYGTLALANAQWLSTIYADSASLVISLSGNNEIYAGDNVAIQTAGELTITGNGCLRVTTENPVAISVAGFAEGENRKGLTVGGVRLSVTVVENTEVTEWYPEGISSVHGVRILGNTHLMTSHTAVGQVYTVGEGYYRTANQEAFTKTVTDQEITAEAGSLEVVSSEHLECVKIDEENHGWRCRKTEGESCVLMQAGIDAGGHTESTPAGCEKAAYCAVCSSYYGEVDMTHQGEAHFVPVEGTDQHIQKYAVCGCAAGEAQSHDADVTECPEGSAVLKRLCSVCGFENEKLRITVAAPENLIWDGMGKEASILCSDARDLLSPVKYYTYNGETRSAQPMEEGVYPTVPGTYAAVLEVMVGEETYRPEAVFAISAKQITEEMVKLSSESAVYDGTAKTMPRVTVTDDKELTQGTDFDVAYIRDGEPVIKGSAAAKNAGKIQVTVTGKDNYCGTVVKTYTIEQAEAAALMFDYTAPKDLVYTGSPKEAKMEVNPTKVNPSTAMGETEIRYYKAGKTEPVQPIDAGEYEVRVFVKGTANFKAGELADADWKFTIAQASEYTDATDTDQTIGDGYDSFQWPVFTGIIPTGETEPEEVTGDIVYTYNGSQTAKSVIEQNLTALKDGATAQIGYIFTPEDGGNYAGTSVKTGTIAVRKVKPTFTM